jgi:predicted outer membrane repeat protein
MRLEDCLFESNSADSGGAVALSSSSTAYISTCNFVRNSAADSGGALTAILQSSVTIQDSLFSENQASGFGGGGIRMIASRVDLLSNTFTANNAKGGGGGAILWDADVAPLVRMDCDKPGHAMFTSVGDEKFDDSSEYCAPFFTHSEDFVMIRYYINIAKNPQFKCLL